MGLLNAEAKWTIDVSGEITRSNFFISDAASSIPNQKDFVDYLTKQFDKAPEKKMWCGYAIKFDEDDDQGMDSSIY